MALTKLSLPRIMLLKTSQSLNKKRVRLLLKKAAVTAMLWKLMNKKTPLPLQFSRKFHLLLDLRLNHLPD